MSKMTTNFDDWETDPDFVRDINEIDQRWGNKRTVGSINMNELIDEVRRDHKTMRDKNQHPSQRDYSGGFTRSDLTATPGYGSQEHISRRVITKSSESSYVRETTNGQVKDEAKKSIVEKSTDIQKSQRVPPLAPKPNRLTSRFSPEAASGSSGTRAVSEGYQSPNSTRTERVETKWANPMPYDPVRTEPPKQFSGGSSVTKRIFEEEQKSSSSQNSSRENFKSDSPRRAGSSASQSQAFKTIQDKIDAFKKEFENIESKVAKKSDLSRVIKKTTNVEKQQANDSVQYVTRSSTDKPDGSSGGSYQRSNTTSPPISKLLQSERPTSTSPLRQTLADDTTQPKASIKSLSERFESMGRETSNDFRRRMEERRRDFFDKIKTQVRETRKGLDGFDMIDSDDDDTRVINDPPERHNSYSTSPTSMKQGASRPSGSQSPFSRPSSRVSGDSSQMSSSGVPKVYSKRETTKESIVSRFVKENDKVIHDETKRNVERSSSCHGSSEEEFEQQPSSIKFIDKELRSSPLEQRTQSPIDEIKRKIPLVEPSNKGAGLMARTLYDYQAVERDELTFDVDDLITNIEKIDQGWYKGTITKGDRKQIGLFPANYVKLLNDSDEF